MGQQGDAQTKRDHPSPWAWPQHARDRQGAENYHGHRRVSPAQHHEEDGAQKQLPYIVAGVISIELNH